MGATPLNYANIGQLHVTSCVYKQAAETIDTKEMISIITQQASERCSLSACRRNAFLCWADSVLIMYAGVEFKH